MNISATQQTLIRHLGALGTCEGLWEKPIVSPGLKASVQTAWVRQACGRQHGARELWASGGLRSCGGGLLRQDEGPRGDSEGAEVEGPFK